MTAKITVNVDPINSEDIPNTYYQLIFVKLSRIFWKGNQYFLSRLSDRKPYGVSSYGLTFVIILFTENNPSAGHSGPSCGNTTNTKCKAIAKPTSSSSWNHFRSPWQNNSCKYWSQRRLNSTTNCGRTSTANTCLSFWISTSTTAATITTQPCIWSTKCIRVTICWNKIELIMLHTIIIMSWIFTGFPTSQAAIGNAAKTLQTGCKCFGQCPW